MNPTADSLRQWLALRKAPGIGSRRFLAILNHYQQISAAFEDGFKLPNFPTKARAYLRNPDWQQIDKDIHWAQQPGCAIICLTDPRYPELLKNIPDPPPLLYTKGNLNCFNDPLIAIVGSRRASKSGIQTAHDFAKEFAKYGISSSSGLALGIDSATHRGSLAGSGSTIAVLGSGIEQIYPKVNQKLAEAICDKGLLVSEHPPETPPHARHFPPRNRIISGLALGTLVVEASIKSGSLITARATMEQGREVFAIPSSIHNPMAKGCHQLIKEGAKLVETVYDVMSELKQPLSRFTHEPTTDSSPPKEQEKSSAEPETQSELLQQLGFEPLSIDQLVAQTGNSVQQIQTELMDLELDGTVETLPGGLYLRTR